MSRVHDVREEELLGSFLVRDYDPAKDKDAVEMLERNCEVDCTRSGEPSLFTDLLGDPISRVRHSPPYLMLVADMRVDGGGESRIVGVIRGCVKTVTRGASGSPPMPLYARAGYILGLRVSPYHRRKGVGLQLVRRVEDWFAAMGVEYSYMATDRDNEASVRLFTGRCGYRKFRTPTILVHPVFAHRLRGGRGVSVAMLSESEAELLYRSRFSSTEFFPRDIDAVLGNPLCLGSFVAAPESYVWRGVEAFLREPPRSWAVMSLWNCKEVFRLEVRGVSRVRRALAKATRALDRALPWLRIPSVPDLFRPFGVQFMFGVGGAGPCAKRMVAALCAHAHNMARDGGCGVVATELGSEDPVRAGVPRWRALSCEDLWCMKRLRGSGDGSAEDWTESPPAGPCIFVDPREV